MSIVSATVALAMASGDYRPVLAIIAIGGTVIALDVALAAGVGLVFPSGYSERIPVGYLIFLGVAFVLAIVIAGLAGVGAVTACRRCFTNIDPFYIVISVIVMNAIVVSAGSAFNGLFPDVEFKRIAGRVHQIDVTGDVFYGIDADIGMAAGLAAILFTIFPVAFVSAVTFATATAARRLYSNDRINRTVSVTAIGVSIIASVVAALTAAIYVIYVVTDIISHHASLGRDLDINSAIAAGIVAFLGCTITAVLAGVVTWWYRALRQR